MFRTITLLLLCASTLHAQSVEWTEFFGGEGSDFGYASIPTEDGGFLVAGSTNSFKSHPNALESGYLLKLDDRGTVVWEKPSGSYLITEYREIFSNADGTYTIIGRANAEGSYNTIDLLLTTIDAEGTVLTERTFGSDTWENFSTVIRTADSNYLILGFTSEQKIALYRVDRNGALLWSRFYGTEGGELQWTTDVRELKDGGYILTGSTSRTPPVAEDIYLFRIGAEGDSLWFRSYAAEGSERGEYILPLDNGFLVVGHHYLAPDSYGYSVKVDANGVLQSTRSHVYPNGMLTYAGGVLMDDGSISLAGSFVDGSGQRQVQLTSISQEGDSLSSVTLGSVEQNYYVQDLRSLPEGGWLITGYENRILSQGFVMKVDPLSSGVDDKRCRIERIDLW